MKYFARELLARRRLRAWVPAALVLGGLGAAWVGFKPVAYICHLDPASEMLVDKVARQASGFMARVTPRQAPANLMVLVLRGFITAQQMSDPWGTPLRYTPSGSAFEVRCAGADRVFDTPDDFSRYVYIPGADPLVCRDR